MSVKMNNQNQAAWTFCWAEAQPQACLHSIQEYTAFIIKTQMKNMTED